MAGFNYDFSAATPVLKQRYSKQRVQTLAFKSALLALVPKDTEAGGLSYNQPVRSAVGSTASHNATIAFSSGSSSVYNNFVVPYAATYATANVTADAVDRAKGDENSLVDTIVSEFDGSVIDIGQMLGSDLFGDGGGSFGQISLTSNVATATIQLSNPSQIVNFSQGQILTLSSDDGTGGAGTFTGTVTVTAVDINTGNITVQGTWQGNIPSAAAGSYIFQNGAYAGAMAGLAAWFPNDLNRSNLSTPFLSVVRSADPVRLAGTAVFGNGVAKDVSLIRTLSLVQRMGGRPDMVVLNPLDYSSICTAATSKVQYTTVQSFDNAQLSFKSAELATEYGMVMLVTDVFCPVGQCYVLQTDTLLIPSMGEVPKIWEVDGNIWLRGLGDTMQLRMVARNGFSCSAPGKNAVLRF